MRIRSKHSKFRFYPIGLICLLLIPICHFLIAYESSISTIHVLNCRFMPSVCCQLEAQVEGPQKVYTDVFLRGNKNNLTLIKSKLLIRELVRSNSSFKAIRFRLSDKMKFETYLDLLKLIQSEGARIIQMTEENIGVMNPPEEIPGSNEIPLPRFDA